MSFTPTFKLYQSNGVILVHEFEKVIDWNPDPFQDPSSFVEHDGLRGQGSIIAEGSSDAWDFTLTSLLTATNYENLVSEMESLVSTISKFTNYILKIQKTSGGSTIDLYVKRVLPIQFPLNRQKKVVDFQNAIITFRVETWTT